MFTNRTDIAECIIHNEIKDWFNKIIIEACGPDVQIRYESDDDHIHSRTYVEISGSESQVNAAFELIEKISEKLRYRMPWLHGSPYYVRNEEDQQKIEKILMSIKNDLYTISCTEYNVTGCRFILISFRPDLDDATEMELDEVFESLPKYNSPFITYPESRFPMKKSTSYITTKMLTELHGGFLPYLSLKDVLSLEIANLNDSIPYDTALHQDIQKHLRDHYAEFYEGDQIDDADLLDFKINSVLLYCIHKYHDRFKKITISNILTTDEIKALTDLYNIEIENQSIVHIDFKSRNELGIIDCCAMYHFDSIGSFIPNYDPKYSTENHTLHFKEDDSLDVSNDTNKFSYLILKSDTACSSQKTNSILKYVTENFKAGSQGDSRLTLSEFNLNCVSNENLSLLLNMMREGTLVFEKINFELANFIAVLAQSKKNRIEFKKCNIDVGRGEIISNDSEIGHLRFSDMDIELKVLVGLQNISELELINCQVLCNNWLVPCTKKITDKFKIAFTSIDMGTLLKLLNGLQCITTILFLSCDITDHELDEQMHFTIRNIITFSNMKLKVETLFQIFENCEIQTQIVIDDCELHFGANVIKQLQLKTIKINFLNIQFQPSVLITILETLNSKSAIKIYNSDILPIEDNDNISQKIIKMELIIFSKCKLEINTLTTILSKLSENTTITFIECELLNSSVTYSKVLTNATQLSFVNMKIKPQDLLGVLGMTRKKSEVIFSRCEILEQSEVVSPIHQIKCLIQFQNMTIETEIARHLLKNRVKITFNSCILNFMTDPVFKMSIKSHIFLRNMIFDLTTHLKSLANFTPTSKLQFQHCHFHVTRDSQIKKIRVTLTDIEFKRCTFDLEALVIMMEKMSSHTIVCFDECVILTTSNIFSPFPISLPHVVFKTMTLEIKTIQSILKNSTKLSNLVFDNCKIVCSNPSELGNTKLNITLLLYENMDIDVEMFQMFVQKCADGMSVLFTNCNFIPMTASNTISIVPVNIEYIICRDVKYTQGLLQMLQYLDGQFIFQFQGKLSHQHTIEICTKSPVRGSRFSLQMEEINSAIGFELFEAYFRSIAGTSQFDLTKQHDLPLDLLPEINSIKCNTQYWSEYKVQFIYTNNATSKLEFFKNGKAIDIFFEANDIDSSEDMLDQIV